MKNFSLTKTVKRSLSQKESVFQLIKEKVLGEYYNLSLVFVGQKKIRGLNKKFRNKDKTTDILSFPLSKTEGEIFINLDKAETEAKKFGRPLSNFVIFLLIHGLCHLKGMTHSSKMENEERKYRKIFGV